MNLNKRKKIIIGVVAAVILLVIIISIVNSNKNKKVEVTNITIQDNKATANANVEEIEFKDITKVYDSGITTIKANMYNTTDTVKNVTVKIILKDEQGNELTNMMQVVENLQPNRVKVLSTGLAGDYSKVSEIKFEIVK